eukprot:Seg940.19 transcript_id=Seg940.19/GoldUCD/mRNA.D3Y31 product="Solute carrier family 46 member 3" protein_id=Seg940.19/GoldUCD/D3Y31
MAKGCCKSTRKCASEPFIFLYVMCYGANITLFPQLIISKLCHERYNNTVCKNLGSKKFKAAENVVYAQAATWDTIIFSSICVPAIFTILPMGALASMISKRKILFLPPVIVILQSILYIFCARYQSIPLAFVALAAGLTGIFGDLNGAVMLSFTHMASVTNNDHFRTLRFGILEGCVAYGKAFGSLIGGFLLKHYGFPTAFSLGVSASIFNILFIAFFLQEPPESNEKELKVEESVITDNCFNQCRKFLSNLKESFVNVARFARKYFYLPTPGKSVGLVLLAIFFEICTLAGEDIMITLFIKHSPLNLSSDEVGLYWFTLHAIRGTGAAFLGYIATKCFSPSDLSVIILGSMSIFATHIAMAFSTTKEMLFGFSVFTLAFSFAIGGIFAHLTKIVTEDEHGTALSFMAFTGLISINVIAFSANKVFTVTAAVFPGFSILLLVFSSFTALIIMVFVICVVEKSGGCLQRKELGSHEDKEQLPLLKEGTP